MSSPNAVHPAAETTRARWPARAAGILAPALALVLAAAARPGAAEPPPDAAAILDRAIEVTGGKAAYDSIQNRVTKGTLTLAAQNISLDWTEYRARPRLTYVVVESQALGKIESGVNGDVAWENSTMTGPRLKEGAEEQETVRDATFDLMVNWRKAYPKAEVVGTDSVDGKPCWRILLTPRFGRTRTISYDRESGLTRKVEFTVDTQAGVVSGVTVLGDYRKVGALLMPHRIEASVAGQKRVMTIRSVEQNVKLPADRFAPPADVQKLVDARK